MQKSLSIYIGLRYIGARRKSQMVSFLSAISITGLVVGVGLLIVVLSVMNGFDRELREKILGLMPQAVINHHQGIGDWQVFKHQLEQDPEIVSASPYIQQYGLLNNRNNTMAIMLYGIDPETEYKTSLIGEYVTKESFFSLQDSEPGILLGVSIAEKLQVQPQQKVMLVVPGDDGKRGASFGYFVVRGVIKSNTELDNALVLTSIEHAAALTGMPDRVTGMRLRLHDLFAAPSIVPCSEARFLLSALS